MNEITQILVGLTVLIAAFWGALQTLLRFWDEWQKIAKSPQQISRELEEVERQLERCWNKFDELALVCDSRLDRLERLTAYIGGCVGVDPEKLNRGEHDR